MRGWKTIAFLAAALTAAAVGVFGGVFPTGPDQTVPFKQILGASQPSTSPARLPGLAIELAFSRDAKQVIARQEDGKIVAWERESGTGRLLAHTTGAFAYCPAGNRLVISNADATVSLSLNDGSFEPIAQGAHDHAAFSADCEALALAIAEKPEVHLISTQNKTTRLITAQPVRHGLSLSLDGHHLAVAGGRYSEIAGHLTTIEIFDLEGPGSAGNLIAYGGGVIGPWTMQSVSSEHGLFLGNEVFGQSGLRRIDPESGTVIWGHNGFESDWVRGLAMTPNGIYMATGDDDGWLRIWDAETGILLAEKQAGQVIQNVAISPDGRMIALALWDGTIGIVPFGSLM